MSASEVFAQVEKGTTLKHVDTVDKSAPKIENVEIKKNDHGALLKDITHGADLKKTETNDRSDPKIDPNTHIGKNNQSALLGEIKAKGAEN